MNKSHLIFGNLGEQKAVDYFLDKKYKILEQNWRYKKNEIDIIALDGDELVIIELKTRNNSIISIEKMISYPQQKRIIVAADAYIKLNNIDLEVRFDLILVEKDLKTYKFTHCKEIFYPTID